MAGGGTRPKSHGVDVVVRMPDPAGVRKLDRALFSLYGQDFTPVRPIIATQNFSTEELAAVERTIDVFDWSRHARPLVANLEERPGGDFRSKLLNRGLGELGSRYLAFLDHDDFLYGHAYTYLAERLGETGAGVSFGSIVVKEVHAYRQYDYIISRRRPASRGAKGVHLLSERFCPLNSFLVDREVVLDEHLRFEATVDQNEETVFVLNLASHYALDFDGDDVEIGACCLKRDRSNASAGSLEGSEVQALKRAEWDRVHRWIWRVGAEMRTDRVALHGSPRLVDPTTLINPTQGRS